MSFFFSFFYKIVDYSWFLMRIIADYRSLTFLFILPETLSMNSKKRNMLSQYTHTLINTETAEWEDNVSTDNTWLSGKSKLLGVRNLKCCVSKILLAILKTPIYWTKAEKCKLHYSSSGPTSIYVVQISTIKFKIGISPMSKYGRGNKWQHVLQSYILEEPWVRNCELLKSWL